MRNLFIFCLLSLVLLPLALNADGNVKDDEDTFDDFGDSVDQLQQQDISSDTDEEREAYIPPTFKVPTIDQTLCHFVDWFADTSAIGKRWVKSEAKKEGADETVAKYNGEWLIGYPSDVVIENDYGLIVKTKARHHAISASLAKPFKFEGKPLVVQYEVKYEEGQECGGGYVKLLSETSGKLSQFNDKTPYVVMFGPDKCGMTSKVHLILKHKNPKNGTISEHHAKQPTRSLASFFDDKNTHLYTLIISPDNSYKVKVDHAEIMAGNMLQDLDPSFIPPKQIKDPVDKKPEDWDDRAMIEDPTATKPDDWDENQPKEVPDEALQKPADWLEDINPLISDTAAKKPEDWDDDMDGEYEPKQVPNPECEGRSGCGPWTRPMKENPLYKGKWHPAKITNPNYKGQWAPRLIDNPNYFDADPYNQLASIGAIGIELWTMSSGIVFDNVLITDDEGVALDFARQTFDVKREHEALFAKASNPSKGVIRDFTKVVFDAAEERPWLWAVYVLVILVPVIGISVFCFGRKSSPAARRRSHSKKTDELVDDDEGLQDQLDEQDELQQMDDEENEEVDRSSSPTYAEVVKTHTDNAGEGSSKSTSPSRVTAPEQPSPVSNSDTPAKGSPSPRPTRRLRARRQE